jgi:beta-galactosidase/beta-glucuronidase
MHTFPHSSSKPNKQGSTWLVFDGLDTFATIEVCNQFVAYTDNQFRQWYFDITDILSKACKGKAPIVSVNFGSATNITREIALNGDRKWMLFIPLVDSSYEPPSITHPMNP